MLLRIGTKEKTEYRLWITRRFVQGIWGGLQKALEGKKDLRKDLRPEVKEAVLAMEHQESVQSSDFSQKHSSDNVNLPPNPAKLGDNLAQGHPQKGSALHPDHGALLVSGGQVKAAKNGLTQINLKMENGTGVEFMLNKKLLHALCHMIIKSAHKAGWDLKISIGDGNVVVPADQAKLH